MLFDTLRNYTASMLEAIYQHPFNQELIKGTLPLDKFTYYLEQDILYLNDFSKALALIAVRLPLQEHRECFLRFANESIQSEKQLHYTFLHQYSLFDAEQKEQSPFCFIHSNYLLKLAILGTVEEAVASLVPCFWVYQQVGQQALMKARSNINNPYQVWIDLYASPEFDHSVTSAVKIFNELASDCSAQQHEKMIAAFKRSMQLEWNFWQGAYSLENWGISHLQPELINTLN